MTTRSKLTNAERHAQTEQKIWSRKDLLDTQACAFSHITF